MAFYTRRLPYEIARAAERNLHNDLKPSDAFLKAGEEYSPEVYLTVRGKAYIRWWRATPDEIAARKAIRADRLAEIALEVEERAAFDAEHGKLVLADPRSGHERNGYRHLGTNRWTRYFRTCRSNWPRYGSCSRRRRLWIGMEC